MCLRTYERVSMRVMFLRTFLLGLTVSDLCATPNQELKSTTAITNYAVRIPWLRSLVILQPFPRMQSYSIDNICLRLFAGTVSRSTCRSTYNPNSVDLALKVLYYPHTLTLLSKTFYCSHNFFNVAALFRKFIFYCSNYRRCTPHFNTMQPFLLHLTLLLHCLLHFIYIHIFFLQFLLQKYFLK